MLNRQGPWSQPRDTSPRLHNVLPGTVSGMQLLLPVYAWDKAPGRGSRRRTRSWLRGSLESCSCWRRRRRRTVSAQPSDTLTSSPWGNYKVYMTGRQLLNFVSSSHCVSEASNCSLVMFVNVYFSGRFRNNRAVLVLHRMFKIHNLLIPCAP